MESINLWINNSSDNNKARYILYLFEQLLRGLLLVLVSGEHSNIHLLKLSWQQPAYRHWWHSHIVTADATKMNFRLQVLGCSFIPTLRKNAYMVILLFESTGIVLSGWDADGVLAGLEECGGVADGVHRPFAVANLHRHTKEVLLGQLKRCSNTGQTLHNPWYTYKSSDISR